MKICPDKTRLHQFIEGQLSDEDFDTLDLHIESCHVCQNALAELTDSSTAPMFGMEQQAIASSEFSQLPKDVLERFTQGVMNDFRQNDSSVPAIEVARPAADTSDFQPTHLGDYEIVREIGRGGMGVVYEARQVSLNRIVALKVLPQNFFPTESSVLRFRREARAASQLHHTNIVPIFEVGEADGTHYYSMQWIDGINLAQFARKETQLRDLQASDLASTKWNQPRADGDTILEQESRPIVAPEKDDARSVDSVRPSGETDSTLASTSTSDSTSTGRYQFIAQIGCQIADALEHAHQREVIHRDVKPANLILDREEVVWLADFGLAKQSDDHITGTMEAPGTIRYMSPERFRGECDLRSDVYALGVTLYELILQQPAFDATDSLALLKQVNEIDPPSPRSIDPTVPRDLETIVQKAMAKEPSRRYATARLLHDDLDRFLNGLPISARPVSHLERLWLWSKKHRAYALSLATIAVLVTATAIGSTFAALYYRDQEQLQIKQKNEISSLASEKAAETEEVKKQRDTAFQNAYFADIRQAHQDWENGQVRRMLSSLRNYVPNNSLQDIRGWEWYYLLSLAHQEETTILSHQGVAKQIEWSADGQRLFGLDSSGTLNIWSRDGKLVSTLADSGIRGFSLNAAGPQVATVTQDNAIRIFDVESGRSLREIRTEHPLERHIDWSHDGKRILVIQLPEARTYALTVFDVSTGRDIWQQNSLNKQLANPSFVKFSKNGRRILWASVILGAAVIHDIEDDTFFNLFTTRGHAVTCGAWHSDNEHFAVGTFLQGVRLLKVDRQSKNPKIVSHFQNGSTVDSVAFSADHKQIIVGNRSQRVDRFELTTQAPLASFKGHLDTVRSIAPHPSLDVIATSSDDGSVKIWNAAPASRSTGMTNPDSESQVNVRASAEVGGYVCLTDPTMVAVKRFRAHHLPDDPFSNKSPNSGSQILAAVSPNGRMVASCYRGEVKLWDTITCKELGSFYGHTPGSSMSAVAWGKSSQVFATAGEDQTINIWNPKLNERTRLRGLQGTALAKEFGFSADDSRFMATGPHTRKVWDVKSGREILSFAASAPSFYDDFQMKDPTVEFRLSDEAIRFALLGKTEAISDNHVATSEFEHQQQMLLAEALSLEPRNEQNVTDRALALSTRALSLKPSDPQTLLAHGLAQFRAHEFSAAIPSLKKVSDVAANRMAVAKFVLAICLKRTGLSEEAKHEFAMANSILNEIPVLETMFHSIIRETTRDILLDRSQTSNADTIVVNTLQDESNGIDDGTVSLREAILFVRDGGTISFDVQGTIALKCGPIEVTRSLSILGPGANQLTISGNHQSQIFVVDDGNDSSQSNVNVSGLRFTKAHSASDGGPIASSETLTIVDSEFAENYGGMLVKEGSDCVIRRSTFVRNTGLLGGAIQMQASSLTIDSCTFDSNLASVAGGAVATGVGKGRLSISNSTFTRNISGVPATRLLLAAFGTIRASCEETTIEHCTFTDNKGGDAMCHWDQEQWSNMDGSPKLMITNCIMASDLDAELIDVAAKNASFTAIQYSIVHTDYQFTDGGHNLRLDPQLSPLADNGGPTKTQALSAGSPAIDAGSPSKLKFDQRGEPFQRSVDGDDKAGAAPDIGAFEFEFKSSNE